jgi:hypothetical protein
MNQKASSIGDLAVRALSKGKPGEVTRVFQRSAYVRSGNRFILLLWGGLRSDMTVNVVGEEGAGTHARVGERCVLRPDAVVLRSGIIEVKGAETFRSALLNRKRILLPAASALTKGVAMLRALYEVSPSGPTLVGDKALWAFATTTLAAFASGKPAAVRSLESYAPLLGRGGGFTPAGDDFVGGLLTALNYVARCRRGMQVLMPRQFLLAKTIPESAAILDYSARGYVDEDMGRLVLKTLDGSDHFFDELMTVAHRGHTSGIDMSLGVLLCEAALAQTEGERDALKRCLGELWNP